MKSCPCCGCELAPSAGGKARSPEHGGWATIQVVSEIYGHLEQQAIDDAVRGAGAGLAALPKQLPRKKEDQA